MPSIGHLDQGMPSIHLSDIFSDERCHHVGDVERVLGGCQSRDFTNPKDLAFPSKSILNIKVKLATLLFLGMLNARAPSHVTGSETHSVNHQVRTI
eukprot:873921-Prorocentrum_minimum.AAC.1